MLKKLNCWYDRVEEPYRFLIFLGIMIQTLLIFYFVNPFAGLTSLALIATFRIFKD